jgi:hypothetical protein
MRETQRGVLDAQQWRGGDVTPTSVGPSGEEQRLDYTTSDNHAYIIARWFSSSSPCEDDDDDALIPHHALWRAGGWAHNRCMSPAYGRQTAHAAGRFDDVFVCMIVM